MAWKIEKFSIQSQWSVLDSWSAIVLVIPGRCSATKVILRVRHYSKFLLPNCTAAWSELPLSDWCKSLPKYCLTTWLGQCNNSDLLQMFWELGILLVVPDSLCGVLISQMTIIPLFDPDHSWPRATSPTSLSIFWGPRPTDKQEEITSDSSSVSGIPGVPNMLSHANDICTKGETPQN